MKRKVYSTKDLYTPEDGWWYLCRHGIGPGTIPKGVNVLEVKDHPTNRWKCYVKLDRVLTTPELQEFDLKEEMPEDEVTGASYGGAFDIEDDAYFTREELDELGSEIQDALDAKIANFVYITNVYCEHNPERIEVDYTSDLIDGTVTERVDYRKIRKPGAILSLAAPLARKVEKEIFEVM